MWANVRNIKHEMNQPIQLRSGSCLSWMWNANHFVVWSMHLYRIHKGACWGRKPSFNAEVFSDQSPIRTRGKGESFVFLSIVTPPAKCVFLFPWNMSTYCLVDKQIVKALVCSCLHFLIPVLFYDCGCVDCTVFNNGMWTVEVGASNLALLWVRVSAFFFRDWRTPTKTIHHGSQSPARISDRFILCSAPWLLQFHRFFFFYICRAVHRNIFLQ